MLINGTETVLRKGVYIKCPNCSLFDYIVVITINPDKSYFKICTACGKITGAGRNFEERSK